MRFTIKHELPERIRVHLPMKRLSFSEADTLSFYLQNKPAIQEAKVYERTADVVVRFKSDDRAEVLDILRDYDKAAVDVPSSWLSNSSRASDAGYFERLVTMVCLYYGRRLFVPLRVGRLFSIAGSVKFIWKALRTIRHKRLEVPVLDAIAIVAALLTGDYDTASSVMFLLDIGDTIEEWTHKKSVEDLARRLSLHVNEVWLSKDGEELLVEADSIVEGDKVIIRTGSVIPFDGEVVSGEASVNQSAMTGEAVPVHKNTGKAVYAGTVVEEGELTIMVHKTGGTGRFDRIVHMIEDSQKLKSSVESRAGHLADRLVPYTLGGSVLTFLLTRNITKTISVLMVDYSCALKLAMPLSVLSAIRQASVSQINVKGGKYLEAVADADTIVFDKTGTLTRACPTVAQVISFNGEKPDELLRQAACLEEHFPHSIANAVVDAARKKGLSHDEMHSKVEYVVAHGISTMINGKRAIIGSYHFVFEDEATAVPEGMQEAFAGIPDEYSPLYYAKEGMLAAVILIDDPLRPEVNEVITSLKKLGFSHVVMMTGDSERTAESIARRSGIEEYYAEVMPEDKAGFVKKTKENGSTVIMVGDGINDSPALSAADAGIAINEGSGIAREIADITIAADGLTGLIELKLLSRALMNRIRSNYRAIISFNTALILLGVTGILPPSASALLHNTSTVAIGLKSMTDLDYSENNSFKSSA